MSLFDQAADELRKPACNASMSHEERIQTLTVVYEALMSEPPQLEAAAMLYNSIPGFEALPLPAPSDLEEMIHLRKQVQTTHDRMAESDARSDPGDNFASQHAMGLAAQRDAAQAEILAAGGTAEFTGLFRKSDGARVPAMIIHNQYGSSWMVCDPVTGRTTKTYYPTGPRSRKQKQAGLEERKERAPARAIIAGRGRGLSGTAWVEVIRLDGGWPGAPEWRKKEEQR